MKQKIELRTATVILGERSVRRYPEENYYMHHLWREYLKVRCPHCGALPGYHCQMPCGRRYQYPHMKRMRAYKEAQRAIEP